VSSRCNGPFHRAPRLLVAEAVHWDHEVDAALDHREARKACAAHWDRVAGETLFFAHRAAGKMAGCHRVERRAVERADGRHVGARWGHAAGGPPIAGLDRYRAYNHYSEVGRLDAVHGAAHVRF